MAPVIFESYTTTLKSVLDFVWRGGRQHHGSIFKEGRNLSEAFVKPSGGACQDKYTDESDPVEDTATRMRKQAVVLGSSRREGCLLLPKLPKRLY